MTPWFVDPATSSHVATFNLVRTAPTRRGQDLAVALCPTTSSFLRLKLGKALQRRNVSPHIYERAEEARAHLRELEQKISA